MNEFHISERRLVIYESLSAAQYIMQRVNQAPLAPQSLSAFIGYYGIKDSVNITEKFVPILCLNKIIDKNINQEIFEYWNVIIGEKIGWIIVHDWHNIKPLEMYD